MENYFQLKHWYKMSTSHTTIAAQSIASAPSSPVSSSGDIVGDRRLFSSLLGMQRAKHKNQVDDCSSINIPHVQRTRQFWRNNEHRECNHTGTVRKNSFNQSKSNCLRENEGNERCVLGAGGPETTSTLSDSASSHNSDSRDFSIEADQIHPTARRSPASNVAENDDACSSYSHASVVDLPPLDDEALSAVALGQKTSIRHWVGGQRGITDARAPCSLASVRSIPRQPFPPLPLRPPNAQCGKRSHAEPRKIQSPDTTVEAALVKQSTTHSCSKQSAALTAADSDCSYAESFAKRTMLGSMERNKSKLKQSVNPGLNFPCHARPTTVSDMVERCAQALAELLDQNPAVVERLTEGTRAYSTLFTYNDKYYFGLVVQRTQQLIHEDHERRTKYFEAVTARTIGLKVVMLRAPAPKSTSLVDDTVHKRVRRKMNDLETAGKVLLGTPNDVALPRRSSSCSYVKRSAAVNYSSEFSLFGFGSPKGPLAQSSSNETIDVNLPFAATLLAVLAVMARLECNVMFKRRKNRRFLDASDRRTRHSAAVCAKARQDLSGRRFSFTIIISGTSPSRVLFKRPRLIAVRRVDDYVDIVIDSKELLTEYCSSVWSRF